MRILITGGAGFIGSHLCDFFLGGGHEVVCMDNLLTGRRENVVHHQGNAGFQFIEHDVTEYIFVDGPLDFILHFAGKLNCLKGVKYMKSSLEKSGEVVISRKFLLLQ